MTVAAIGTAAARLAQAGIETPHVDAELLAAYVLDIDRAQLMRGPQFSPHQLTQYKVLVDRRANREPLQHLTGEAGFRYLTLKVGPGVFVPRPETEVLVGWGIDRLDGLPAPVVVDACAGSGAIALSIAHEIPQAQVHAVELDEAAATWLRRNATSRNELGDPAIKIHNADTTDVQCLVQLDGNVDLVLSNPPYVPTGFVVAPEAELFDPSAALWGGVDGLDVIRKLASRAATLLRPGGWFGFEHGQQQAAATSSLLRASGWSNVEVLRDLPGRPRFTIGQWPCPETALSESAS